MHDISLVFGIFVTFFMIFITIKSLQSRNITHHMSLYSHIHVINAQLAMEMLPNVTTKPHRLGRKKMRKFTGSNSHTWDKTGVTVDTTDLALFDGVCCSLFKQLDGLVVVQSAAAPKHVTQELNTVQLPVWVLGSRVIHKADLRRRRYNTNSETVHLRNISFTLVTNSKFY